MSTLSEKSCVPCKEGAPPMPEDERKRLLEELGGGWKVVDGHRLSREFVFPAFETGLDFVNSVGAVAEEEGHHPDIHLARRKVRVDIWTHTVDGLTESDFVLAAKITEQVLDMSTANMVDVWAMKGESHADGITKPSHEVDRDRMYGDLGDDWTLVDGHHLEREFEFPDFGRALAFVNRIASLSKEAGHHPAIDVGWGRVGLKVFTFPADGLTQKDFEVARQFGEAYAH